MSVGPTTATELRIAAMAEEVEEGFVPSGRQAVMNSSDKGDKVHDFPTPPWATRALVEHVIGVDLEGRTVWEPAAGRNIMADVLLEYAGSVYDTDKFDYGPQYRPIGPVDYLEATHPMEDCDFVITNPPFFLAKEFVLKALSETRLGVAVLLRTNWVEGTGRYDDLFKEDPPTQIAFFSERVPMVRGRWDPKASTATSYSWFVWQHGRGPRPPMWIPPRQKVLLTKPDDIERFASR